MPPQFTEIQKQQMIDLLIDEMSGVDWAANKYVGWNVLKQRFLKGGRMEPGTEAAIVQQALEQAARLQKDAQSVISAINASADVLADAPENVQQAAQLLTDYLSQLIGEGDSGTDDVEDAKRSLIARIVEALTGKGPENEDEDVQIAGDGFAAFLDAYKSGQTVEEATDKLAS